MSYHFEFRPYQRYFCQPLKTSHGIWKVREGIILRITNHAGKVGWGEIAPLPWFGSETLEQALDFCYQLGEKVTDTEINEIPEELPACQFGFESAVEELSRAEAQRSQRVAEVSSVVATGLRRERERVDYCCLLSTGEAALQEWKIAWEEGKRTFKWKIGVSPIETEIKLFQQLIQLLPSNAKLRLDANGGLSLNEAKEWLEIADEVGKVEFIEQPLSPYQFDTMLELSANYSTDLALDESVATLKQLEDCYQKGWRGIFVIKAAIAGSPRRLRQFFQQYQVDAVFSSVFETKIGQEAVLHLTTELSHSNYALGFGVNHWFEDEDNWLENLWN